MKIRISCSCNLLVMGAFQAFELAFDCTVSNQCLPLFSNSSASPMSRCLRKGAMHSRHSRRQIE
jgi:hypothetical protein